MLAGFISLWMIFSANKTLYPFIIYPIIFVASNGVKA